MPYRHAHQLLSLYRQAAMGRAVPYTPAHYPRAFSAGASHRQKRPSIPPILGSHTTRNFPPEGGGDPKEFLSQLDVLSGLPAPPSAVDSVFLDGFLLNDGQTIRGDGVFLLSNDALRWRALLLKGELEEAEAKAKETSVLELPDESWGLLDVVYPKPGIVLSPPTLAEIFDVLVFC